MGDNIINNEQRTPIQNRSKKKVQQILDATVEIIAEKGSAGLSITWIAKRAGVTAGSMYQYFPNKDAIVYALAEFYLEEIGKQFEAKFQSYLNLVMKYV